MKRRYVVPLFIQILLVTACLSQTGEDGNAAPLMRVTVVPASETPIWVKTSPNAKCTLHPDGLNDAKHSLHLYADEDGMVRFHTRSAAESDTHAKLVLRCQAGGITTIHPIELRAAFAPTSDMPAPVVPTQRAGIPRPAFTGDPMAPSNDELLRMGYPPRPDPQKAPQAYASWLRMISKPATFIPPQMVASNSIAGPTAQLNYSTWSGFELRLCLNRSLECSLANDTSPYWWITGQWYVPSVTGECCNTATYSALWIGLDGDLTLGLKNLIQAGSEQDAFNVFGFAVSVYQVWTEWWPAQFQQFITNFQVNPRDEILTYVWLSHYPTTDFFIAYIFDLTTSQYTAVPTPVPTGTILGTTAEWIMERPQQSNGTVIPDLADYGIAGMSNTEAVRVNGEYVTYNGSVNAQIEMVNPNDNNNELSAVYPVDATDMLFVWLAFH